MIYPRHTVESVFSPATAALEAELAANHRSPLAVGGSPVEATNDAIQCREGCIYPLSGQFSVLQPCDMVGRVPLTLVEDYRSGLFALALEGGFGPKHGDTSIQLGLGLGLGSGSGLGLGPKHGHTPFVSTIQLSPPATLTPRPCVLGRACGRHW